MSTSSTPTGTPSRSRTIPRPPPSPARPPSPTPSASTLSAAAATPRRASTPAGTNTAPLPSPGPADRAVKPRARDLLRKHYGLGVGPPPPLQGADKPLDPMDIDSPAFDAKSYYDQLIVTSSLVTLIKRENTLQSEIRQFESERQALVYNHHHELIAASDTISAMRSRADSLDSDLDKLKVAFSEISRLSADISSASGRPRSGERSPSTSSAS
ncbi:hypothetical protein SCHPADRAFT_834699 [Schizopora paradoxa]|uniref:Vacuolar protein sorting-associated protein 51 homolog n=1 Tax=Schizopora paradoxa TaxID=27342 RepID=A0A0H2RBV2_9AGAM|nr:hypothetical protein SCHPADRAFT_834699 [Schizopora paradoxa]